MCPVIFTSYSFDTLMVESSGLNLKAQKFLFRTTVCIKMEGLECKSFHFQITMRFLPAKNKIQRFCGLNLASRSSAYLLMAEPAS